MEILRVSSKSNPNSVAGAIVGLIKSNDKVEMQVVGAGALNQAVKAVAIARGFVVASGIDLVCRSKYRKRKSYSYENYCKRIKLMEVYRYESE